jgi:GrpB-like predicted nucleotidyltransferase (UPF0157 family)
VVVAYDPGWPGLFQRLGDRIDAALTGVAHITEHVGSTAVPGLAAKPVIDVDVVVPDQTAADAATGALAAAGWQHQGDLGITGREAFVPPADAVYHHLYVVVARSQPHRDHIDFRDFLRGHPGHAARYGELKRQLAVLLETDREAYIQGKADMITGFLRLARRQKHELLGGRVAANSMISHGLAKCRCSVERQSAEVTATFTTRMRWLAPRLRLWPPLLLPCRRLWCFPGRSGRHRSRPSAAGWPQ